MEYKNILHSMAYYSEIVIRPRGGEGGFYEKENEAVKRSAVLRPAAGTAARDGVLSAGEIAAVTESECSWGNIASLKGIEYFTALTCLDCGYNDLTSLDVSGRRI